jgi:hypothetical protein
MNLNEYLVFMEPKMMKNSNNLFEQQFLMHSN